jgi:glycosyltransferase involved in cell wall biosynthesis
LEEFNIVHIFGLYDLLGPRAAKECRKRNIPYLVEPIGMFVPIVRSVFLKRAYHRLWGREMLAGAAAIVVTSEQEREELLAGGIAAEKVILRRNGVDVPSTMPARGSFRRALRIADRDKLILFLGRLSQKKSPDLLLQAFAGLPESIAPPDAVLHLAFVGPDESGMKSQLTHMAGELGVSGRVHFSPPLEGNAKWSAYRDADIFVLPSQNENFGNTAAEAVAAGTPVIVTEQCGIAPLLKDTAGLIVRHEEVELRNALIRLLENENVYKSLQQGCRKAMANLAWDQPLGEMEYSYSMLARRGAA